MIKIFLSSIQWLVPTNLHIKEQCQVDKEKKQIEKYIILYVEELENLLNT